MIDRTFIIDSQNLDLIRDRLYGCMITDDSRVFLDTIPDEVSDTGLFCLVRRDNDTIYVRQDPFGSFGLFLYRDGDRFCLSNSFFRLAEYLDRPLTPDEVFLKDFFYAYDAPFTNGHTLVREIRKLDPSAFVKIDLPSRSLTVSYDRHLFCGRPLDSAESFAMLDAWYKKWCLVFRGLVKAGFPVACDLSGGLDTRVVLSMLRNANIDIPSSVRIRTHTELRIPKDREDLQIAEQIAGTFGFSLNDPVLFPEKIIGFHTPEEAYLACKYTSFGRNLLSKYQGSVYETPFFELKGILSPAQFPFLHLEEYLRPVIEPYLLALKKEGFPLSRENKWNYTKQLIHYRRTAEEMLEGTSGYVCFPPAYIYTLHRKGPVDGVKALEKMNANLYPLSPFMDSVFSEFIFRPDGKDALYLMTLLFDRYDPAMLEFPIEKDRHFCEDTLKEVRALNKAFPVKKEDLPYLKGRSRKIGKTCMSRSELAGYLQACCREPVPEGAELPFLSREEADAILAETDFSRIHSGPQKINFLLTVKELAAILRRSE